MSKKSSPKKPAGNKLFSLRDVVHFPNKIASTIGVILDCTGTYRTDESYDYVTKLRVIDNKYNPKNKTLLNTEPTVYIFIYTKTEAEAPKLRNIGDVILLRNFIFDNYVTKEGNIVRGNFNRSCSEWQILSGRASALMQSTDKSRLNPSKLFVEELEQIRVLRDWLNSFFVNNSLNDLGWYDSEFPQQLAAESVYQLKDVDLLVRVVAEVRVVVNGLTYHKLVFVDERRVLYFAELQKSGLDFEPQSVVKLRSICIFLFNNSRKIDFFNYSSIIFLPNHFKDAKEIVRKTCDIKFSKNELESQFFEELHLEKYTKQQISSNIFIFTSNAEKTGKGLKNGFIDKFPQLEQYDLSSVDTLNRKKGAKSDSRIGSVFLSKHNDLPITPLDELDKILKICHKSPSKLSPYNEQNYRIRAQIESMNVSSVKGIAKLYSASQNKTWDISEKELALLSSKDVKVIIYAIFQMSEKDKPAGKEIPIYLVTFDGNPENIFDLWKTLPDVCDVEEWTQMNPKVEKKFSEMLKALVNPEVEYDFILQLLRNAEGNIYFRIVDSLFWFQNL